MKRREPAKPEAAELDDLVASLDEDKLWGLARKVEAERSRRENLRKRAELKERQATNERVLKAAAMLLQIFNPPHAGNCTDSGMENDDSCPRCALLSAVANEYLSDTVRFELNAYSAPICVKD